MHSNGIIRKPGFGNIFDDLFDRSISDIVGTDFTSETPSVNIIETDDAFDIEVAAPGLAKSDFDVSIDKDHLIISAEHQSDGGDDVPNYKRREYDYKKFTRKFRLPNTVDKESINARYNLGILTVSVAKTAEAKDQSPRTIKID